MAKRFELEGAVGEARSPARNVTTFAQLPIESLRDVVAGAVVSQPSGLGRQHHADPRTGILTSVSASVLLGVVLLLASGGLLTVGLLGWRQRLPRNRFAGIRTPATLRSEAAFSVANRVAAPPVLAAAVVCAAGGALTLGTAGSALAMIVGVSGAGTVGLLLAGGLLGHRVAAAIPPPPARCPGCACDGGSCTSR